MACLKRRFDFGPIMGVGLTFPGKKADLCTKNARVMNKKAEKTKKMAICVSKRCVFLYKFYSARRGGFKRQKKVARGKISLPK
jgi:hypothetical protein